MMQERHRLHPEHRGVTAQGRPSNRLWRGYVALCFLGLSNPVGVSHLPATLSLALIGIGLHLAGRRVTMIYVSVPLTLFVAWSLLSLLWSGDFRGSAAAWLVLAAALVIGTVSITNCDPVDLRSGVWLGGLIAIALSFGVALVAPGVGLVTETYQMGALQGIYVHRNQLAFTIVVALAAGYGLRDPGPATLRHVGSVGVALLALVATRSSTAITCFAVFLVSRWAFRRLGRRPPGERLVPALSWLLLAVLSAPLVTLNLASAVEILGRDTTLTGRTDIWAAVWPFIQQRVLTGYGWGGVWGEGDEPGGSIRATIGFFVNHSHNGYLDTWLQVGAVGLGLLIWGLASGASTGLRVYFRSGSHQDLWAPLTILMLFVYDMTETRSNSTLGFTVILLAAGSTQRAWRQLRAPVP